MLVSGFKMINFLIYLNFFVFWLLGVLKVWGNLFWVIYIILIFNCFDWLMVNGYIKND